VALSLSSVADVIARIGTARDVAFGSYFLPQGPMRDALAGAARRGAHVAVTLQADPYRNPHGRRDNREAARLLTAAGAEVSLLRSARAPFHLKAAVCDGTAYLDDRNWTAHGPEMVIADDDPSDVSIVRDAVREARPAADATIALRKDEALRRELLLVEAAGDAPVVVETERVRESPLTAALRARARAGAPTTLIVGRTRHHPRAERRALRALASDGVVIREGGTNQKLALAGGAAWIGSGNATGAGGRSARQVEWGLVTRDAALVGAVRTALERDVASTGAGD
jgi:phosphatidylserine/phosphatidylglycerophosphate/cardiolipin synthase-like enzyme